MALYAACCQVVDVHSSCVNSADCKDCHCMQVDISGQSRGFRPIKVS